MTFRGLQQGLTPFGYQRLADYTQIDGPLPLLLGKDTLPNRQMDWPVTIGAEPNPRRGWEYHYLFTLIGQDIVPGEQYTSRPDPITWLIPWSLNLLQSTLKPSLPFAQYDWSNPQPVIWYRSWEEAGNTQIPFGGAKPFLQSDWPNPTLITWYQSWTQDLLQSTLTPVLSNPFYQLDWPNPQGVQWYRSWEYWYNLNLIGKDTLPFRSTDRPNPYPVVWYRDWNQNLAGFLLPPFNQEDWPVPKGYPPLTPSWSYSYNPNLIGQDKLPFNQKDWPVPQPVFWYQDHKTNAIYIIPTGPKPFNQQDWPNPGPIPFRDYGYINFTVNIPSPPSPPVGPTTGGRQVYDAELALASRDWHSRQLEYAKDSLLHLSNKLRAEHSAAASRLGKLGADSRWNKK